MTNWTTAKLARLVELETGKREKGGARVDGGVPSIGGEHISDRGAVDFASIRKYISEGFYSTMRQGRLKSGDVLLVKDGATTGRPGWIRDTLPTKAAVNEHVFVLRAVASSNLDNGFLFYTLCAEAGQRQLAAKYHGLIGGVNRSDVLELEIPFPPLDEQRQIAAVLSAVQRAIERQERLIALTAELKTALMHKLFTEGIRGEPLKQTEIGPVPESWEIVPLGSIAKIGNGSTPKRNNVDYWEGGTIPWLTSGKIHEGHITKPDQYVTETAKAECHLPLVAAGSLLIAITGEGKTLGNAALVEFDTCVSQHLAYVQFHQANVVPAFLLYFLQCRYAHLRQMSVGAGSTKKALTCGLLKRYEVPLPHQDEQKAIASTLDAVIAKLQGHKRAADCLRFLFRTLLHQLMTAQIRVHDRDLSAIEEARQELVGAV